MQSLVITVRYPGFQEAYADVCERLQQLAASSPIRMLIQHHLDSKRNNYNEICARHLEDMFRNTPRDPITGLRGAFLTYLSVSDELPLSEAVLADWQAARDTVFDGYLFQFDLAEQQGIAFHTIGHNISLLNNTDAVENRDELVEA